MSKWVWKGESLNIAFGWQFSSGLMLPGQISNWHFSPVKNAPMNLLWNHFVVQSNIGWFRKSLLSGVWYYWGCFGAYPCWTPWLTERWYWGGGDLFPGSLLLLDVIFSWECWHCSDNREDVINDDVKNDNNNNTFITVFICWDVKNINNCKRVW